MAGYFNNSGPKRGRPFTQMGEFDLSLIREFRNRPAFYDRNCAEFKDKVYTAHEWQQISNKLGYDVSLLKDRMLQLRNRYNLEKRRLEQLREENVGSIIESPWPLYSHLQFLSDHIRARRSYKRLAPNPHSSQLEQGDLSNSGSNASLNAVGQETHGAVEPFANGLLTVKMEENASDDEVQNDSENVNKSDGGSTHTPSHNHSVGNTVQNRNNTANMLPASITIRRLETMRENGQQRNDEPQQRHSAKRPSPLATSSVNNVPADNIVDKYMHSGSTPAKQICRQMGARESKYASFGNFISSSLMELPPRKALLLVEKFTSEVVKVLIQSNDADGTAEAAAADAPTPTGTPNGVPNGQ